MLKLGFFASGRGSNVRAILDAVDAGNLDAEPRLIIAGSPDAGVIELAQSRSVPAEAVSRRDFSSREDFVAAMRGLLARYSVDFIALAGYMKRLPPEIIETFPNRITNIHPGLLPAFGGKGMYGRFVHEAVLKKGCKVSGVTIHLVDPVYDHGPIVAQRCVPVFAQDSPDDLAARVLKTEHQLYCEALQWFAEGRVNVRDGIVFIDSVPGKATEHG